MMMPPMPSMSSGPFLSMGIQLGHIQPSGPGGSWAALSHAAALEEGQEMDQDKV
jgi:hypothetical protein